LDVKEPVIGRGPLRVKKNFVITNCVDLPLLSERGTFQCMTIFWWNIKYRELEMYIFWRCKELLAGITNHKQLSTLPMNSNVSV
jgi:hypothetical protein